MKLELSKEAKKGIFNSKVADYVLADYVLAVEQANPERTFWDDFWRLITFSSINQDLITENDINPDEVEFSIEKRDNTEFFDLRVTWHHYIDGGNLFAFKFEELMELISDNQAKKKLLREYGL